MIDYAGGLGVFALLVGGATLAGRALSARSAPPGPVRALATAVLALGLVVVPAELLGAVGAFGRPGLIGIGAVLAGSGWRYRPARGEGRPSSTLAAPVAALLAAEWTGRVVAAARSGVVDVDSLRYHLPLAAGFLQSGWTTRLHYTELDLLSAFDPLHAEVVHAVGMAAFRSDLLSPVVNCAWLALALFAGWCVGAPTSRWAGVTGMLVAAVVCGTPLSSVTMAGAATNDVAVVALVLAAVALLMHAPGARGAAVAGVAIGLAVGTKFAAVAPALALTAVVVVLAPPGRRRVQAGAWLAGAVPAGAFWYVRNAIRAGSPVPSLRIPGLPSPTDRVLDATGFSVAHYALRRTFWRHVVPSGLHAALGPAWPVLVGLGVTGVIVPVVWARPEDARWQRGLAGAAVLCAVAYAVTPYSAGGPDGDPWLFPVDVRFAFPAVVLAMVALARWAVPSRRARGALVSAFALVLVVEQFGSFNSANPAWVPGSRGTALVVGLVALALVAAWSAWPARRPILAGTTVVVVIVMGAAARADNNHWYREGPAARAVDRWAAGVRHARIAVVGVPLQYPLYGRGMTNWVQYAGRPGPHGSFDPITGCPDFVAGLGSMRADYAVIGPDRVAPTGTPEVAWVTAAGGRVVVREGPTSVVAIPPELDASACR